MVDSVKLTTPIYLYIILVLHCGDDCGRVVATHRVVVDCELMKRPGSTFVIGLRARTRL